MAMGSYVRSDDILNFRAISMIGAREETVNVLINGVEARVNSVLKAQGYPSIPVPVADADDYAQVRQMVTQKVVALAYTSARAEVPEWVSQWDQAFEDWLKALSAGEVVLLNQTPAYPGKKARMVRLRILPPIPDDTGR